MLEGIAYLESLAKWRGDGVFDLNSISEIMRHLGDPQDKVSVVQVGGTNGKGSTAAAIASILGVAGHRVGLYTSPHLLSMNERIVIDGVPIEDEPLSALARRVKQASETIDLPLSMFEALTAVAYLGFYELGVEFAVIEVGLGGRLDATSVVALPRVAVITSVDFDHESILGGTIKKIAWEKGGIIKPGGRVYVGPLREEALKVIKQIALEREAELLVCGEDFFAKDLARDSFTLEHAMMRTRISPALPGAHQIANMAIAAVVANDLGIDANAIGEGIRGLVWPGRLESFSYQGREVLFDAAHNPAGIKALIAFLESRGVAKVDLVFGVLRTKSWHEMIASLSSRVRRWYLLAPPSEMAVSAAELSQALACIGISDVTVIGSADELPEVGNHYRAVPLVVAGSIYNLGRARQALGVANRPLWVRRIKSKD